MKDRVVQKGVFQAEVLSNQQIRHCYYRLNLLLDPRGSRFFETVIPGQFLQFDLSGVSLPNQNLIPEKLKDSANRQIILRRPFSFSNVAVMPSSDGPSVKVEIMYCVLGPATIRMMSLKRGDTINVLGPLGSGFSIPQDLQNALLVAGGMGSPPILHLASHLKHHYPEMNIVSFIGAKDCENLPFSVKIDNLKGLYLEEFELTEVPYYIATDDGSAGFDGYVSDCMKHWLEKESIDPSVSAVFACGPEAMLAATARLAKDFSLPCQVSMERMMACGIGLCQSCAVETKIAADHTEYQLCCKNGPVFDAEKVVFRT